MEEDVSYLFFNYIIFFITIFTLWSWYGSHICYVIFSAHLDWPWVWRNLGVTLILTEATLGVSTVSQCQHDLVKLTVKLNI